MKSMVILLVVSVATVGVLGGRRGGGEGGNGGKMHEMIKKCMDENGVDFEQMKAAKNGEDVHQNVKCASLCIAKKHGVTSEDGTIDREKVLNFFLARVPEQQKEQARGYLHTCAQSTGLDECDTAYEIWKCIQPKIVYHKGDNPERYV